MEALATTRASLRIMTRLVGGLVPVPEKLRAAFAPGVFATDRALELVAGGMAFRDAYHQVRDHLDELAAMDPDAAVAAKTHLGATAGLDFAMYAAWLRHERQTTNADRRRADRAFAKLMKPIAD